MRIGGSMNRSHSHHDQFSALVAERSWDSFAMRLATVGRPAPETQPAMAKRASGQGISVYGGDRVQSQRPCGRGIRAGDVDRWWGRQRPAFGHRTIFSRLLASTVPQETRTSAKSGLHSGYFLKKSFRAQPGTELRSVAGRRLPAARSADVSEHEADMCGWRNFG